MTLLCAAHAGAKTTPAEIEAYLKTPSPGSAQPNPAEVAAYRESFGVSKAEATERLKLQTRGAAAHIGEALQEKLGESYGGLWFDNEAGEYVVALASPASARGADRGAVATELATVSLDGSDYRTTVVDDSWSDLLDAGDRLSEELKGLIEQRTARVSIDPTTNSVSIGVRKSADASALAQITRLAKSVGVDVEVETGEQKQFEKKLAACQNTGFFEKSCSQPMRGGVGIREAGQGTYRGHECTSAFRARSKSDGKHYFLTAAHCVKELDEFEEEKWEDVVWDWETWDPVTWTGQSIGTLTEWHFPYHDWAKIDVTDTWADASPWNSIAYWGRGEFGGIVEEEYFIYGEAESQVGAQACHSGITSGTTCGHVTRLEKAFNPSESENEGTIVDAWELENVAEGDDLCIEGGDSGGSVFANHYALGIVSYGTEWYCDPESSMNYVKIEEATEDLNVSLNPAANAPAVSTDTVTGYPAPHQATARGYLYGGGISANYHFDYGVSNGIGQPFAPYESSSSLAATGEAIEYKTGTLTGLKGGTTYHFRAVVQNSAETAKGISKTFTTPLWKPLVTPEGESEVGVSEETGHAKLNARVNPQGSSTTYRFEWGKASEGFPNSVPVPDANIGSGTADVAVSQEITGLKGQTTYYWRVVTSNEDGQTISPEQSFTTPDWRPAVTTEAQTGVKVLEEEGQATLHGKVNPKGFATDYRFEWGTQAEYEEGKYNNSIPAPDGEAGSGEADVSVEAAAKGLKGQSTYHFRLVAENVEGQSPEPQDKSFTTPDWRPLVLHSAAVGIGAGEATLISRINPRGFATTYQIEWGDQAEYEAGEYNNEIEGGSLGSGELEVEIEKQLEGLKPRRAYHFRVIAENAEGTHAPIDVLFKTSTAGIVATGYPLTLKGSPVGNFSHSFNGVVTSCTGPSFEAVLEEGVEAAITSSVEDMSCENPFTPSKWEMDDCQFEFDPGYGDLVESEGEFNIGPPGCGPITTKMGYCEIAIPPQVGLPATFVNEGEGTSAKIEISVATNDLRYSRVSGMECSGPVEAADGGLWGTWEVAAKAVGGVSVTPAFQVGPEVQTEGATEIGANGATLHGTVDTLGAPALWGFEYGLEVAEEYESLASGGGIQAGTVGPQAKDLTVAGLLPDHTYHYRIGAGNSGGVSKGEDRTFTTEAAHPARFTASEYPALLSGATELRVNPTGEEGGFEIECDSTALDGSLASAATEVALAPAAGDCTTYFGEVAAAIEPNSCALVLGVANSGPPYGGGLAVECAEEGDAIEFPVPSIGFTLAIGPQTTGGSLGYENQGAGAAATIAAQGAATGVSFTCKGAYLCSLLGFPTSGEDGVLSLDASLEGDDEEEGALGISFEAPSEAGVLLAGEEGAEGEEPRVEATEYPALLSGATELKVNPSGEEGEWFEIECDSTALNGSLVSAATEVALAPAAGDCTTYFGEVAAAIEPNSCALVLGVANSGPPYGGGLAVECAEEGDAIEFPVPSIGFTLAIGPQTTGGSLGYENQGAGAAATIAAQGAATGVSFTCKGGAYLCGLLGFPSSGEDGVLSLDAVVGGLHGG